MIKVLKMKDESGAITIMEGEGGLTGLLITQSNGDAAAVTMNKEEIKALRAALFDM